MAPRYRAIQKSQWKLHPVAARHAQRTSLPPYQLDTSRPEGTPTSHYRPAETRVGRRWRGSLPNADLGESLVKGEIEGLDHGHGVRGWWVAEPFSEKSGAHLDKQVHRLIVEPPSRVCQSLESGLLLRSSLKCCLIWLLSPAHKRLLIAFPVHRLSMEIT